MYVSHTGLVSGAERSLLGLLETLPADVEPRLACPPGPLSEQATALGVPTVLTPAVVGSLKLHPFYTTTALRAMAHASLRLLGEARRWQPDLIHANSVRPALIALPVARALRRPAVLYVRDCLPPSVVTARLQALLIDHSDGVLAISRHVAEVFDPERRARLIVADDPVDLTGFDPGRFDREAARERLGIALDAPVLTLVGQITPWKGQEEAIRALATVRRAHPTATLLIVGEAKFVSRATRYDNVAYVRRLEDLAAELGLEDAVRFLGERPDVAEILCAADVSLVPSWEEPFGRVVVEAMAMGLPVVATSVGGPAEVIDDGVDGVLVPPRRPDALADATARLLDDDAERGRIGAAARRAAVSRFGEPTRHANRVTALYREILVGQRSYAAAA
jgi:glycosyltransferase involved in cell wall biosynthesis